MFIKIYFLPLVSKTTESDIYRKLILPNLVFTCFPILTVKLECFQNMKKCIYYDIANLNGKKWKNYALTSK